MTTNVREVRDLISRRDLIEHDAQKVVGRAERAGRDLLASEAREFDRLMVEMHKIDDRLDDVPDRVRTAARELLIDEARDAVGAPRDFTMSASQSTFDEFVAMIRDNREGHVDLDVGAMLADKRTLRNGAIEHRSALLTTTTGAPVPIATASTVYEYLVTGSGVLRTNIDIMNTANGESFRMPRFTAYSSGTAVAEGTAIPQSDPTFAHVTFGAYKYGAVTEWSRELEFDSNVPLGTYLGRNLGIAISEAFAPDLVNGAGTAGPQGVLGGTPAGTVTGGTGVAGVPTVNEIFDLVYTLDAPYQAQASFVMHPTTLVKIAKIKDTNDRSILVPSLATDVPSTILGYPVITDTSMPTTGTSKKSIIFGDFSRYASVRFAGPLRVEVSYDAKFTSDLVVCKAVQRLDSRVVDPKAAAVYVGGAS